MSQASDNMVAAQEAIRAGNKRRARQLLHDEVARDPQNFRAWLWLAGLAASPQDSLDYVRRAQQLRPHDPGVQKARAWAEQRLARQQTSHPAARDDRDTAPRQSIESPRNLGATAAQRVDALRDQKRGDAVQRPASKKRKGALVAAAAVLAVMIAAVVLWPRVANQWTTRAVALNASAGDFSTGTATPAPTPSSIAADLESESSALHFVSGQFAPNSDAFPATETEEALPPQATATSQPISLQAKPVNRNDNNPRPTWTLTPSPTFTPTATPTPVPTFVGEDRVVGGALRPPGVGPNERWIDVNLSTQTLVAYEGDRAVFDTLISSGTWLYPTVTGQFRVWLRYTAQTMDGRRLGYDYYLPNVPYVMYFYRDYALHGTYWHNNFGTPMSHGCVNLPTPAAEWIFNWSSIGTLVNVHH